MARRDFDEDENAEPQFEFTVTQARRKGIKALVLLFGHSGSGKTYSALRLARGLVGENGTIGMLDTEHNRGLHYANEFDYVHAMMSPPFTPARYLKALEEFERQGVDCMIVDSMSHVQEGEGGLIDMAAEEERKAGGKVGMGSQWAKPKAEWKRVRNRFLQSRMDIIFCARAKNPLEAESPGSRKLIAGDLVPIMPKNFEYEVTVSLGIEVDTHALIPVKLPTQLAGAFPEDEYISESSGEMMRQWLDGEQIVDRAFEALKDVGREQAAKGVPALKAWWESLAPKHRLRLKDFLENELKPMTGGKAPQPKSSASGGARSDNDPPARGRNAAPPPPPPSPPAPKQTARKPASPPPPPPPPPNDFDVDDEQEGDEKPPAPADHDYPPIDISGKPDWSSIAGDICDFIEGNPDDVELLKRFYADVIAAMQEQAPRSYRMVESVINKATMG